MQVKSHHDCETRSLTDIKKRGAKIYAEDPSTDIMSWSYCVKDGEIKCLRGNPDQWTAEEWSDLYNLAADPNVIFVAHNAFFEQCIWAEIMVKRYGFPPIPIERWECTAAKCFFNGYPGKLELALKALRSPFPKDKEGHKVMLKLSKRVGSRSKLAKKGRVFHEYEDCPDQFEILYRYNIRDVEGERWIDDVLRDLSPVERQLWIIDQKINHTGMLIDQDAVSKAVELAQHNKRNLFGEFRGIIGDDAFDPTQRTKLLMWLQDNGVEIRDTKKETIKELLASGDVPEHVAAALELRLQSNKSSLAKYTAFLNRSVNGLLREVYQYYGAHTGRFAGRGVQPHNFTRPDGALPGDVFLDRLKRYSFELLSFLYPDLARALSVSLRACIIAPLAQILLIADYAQIEARKLAWLAGQQDKIELFIKGQDLYCDQASKIYGYPVTKKMPERQTGKVADLGYGYGGGINAGSKYAKTYGLDLSSLVGIILPTATAEEIDKAKWAYDMYIARHANDEAFEPVEYEEGLVLDILKQRWRLANPAIVNYWAAIENAAIKAVLTGEAVTVRDRVTFFTVDHDHATVLYCKLPSGRMMAYPEPVLHTKESKKRNPELKDNFSLSYKGVHPITKQWVRIFTWGGTLVENIVQASSRDIMRDAMLKWDAKGHRLYLHTHDELASPVAVDRKDELLTDFLRTMVDLEPWAQGCPIEVEGGYSFRYGKPDNAIRMAA